MSVLLFRLFLRLARLVAWPRLSLVKGAPLLLAVAGCGGTPDLLALATNPAPPVVDAVSVDRQLISLAREVEARAIQASRRDDEDFATPPINDDPNNREAQMQVDDFVSQFIFDIPGTMRMICTGALCKKDEGIVLTGEVVLAVNINRQHFTLEKIDLRNDMEKILVTGNVHFEGFTEDEIEIKINERSYPHAANADVQMWIGDKPPIRMHNEAGLRIAESAEIVDDNIDDIYIYDYKIPNTLPQDASESVGGELGLLHIAGDDKDKFVSPDNTHLNGIFNRLPK